MTSTISTHTYKLQILCPEADCTQPFFIYQGTEWDSYPLPRHCPYCGHEKLLLENIYSEGVEEAEWPFVTEINNRITLMESTIEQINNNLTDLLDNGASLMKEMERQTLPRDKLVFAESPLVPEARPSHTLAKPLEFHTPDFTPKSLPTPPPPKPPKKAPTTRIKTPPTQWTIVARNKGYPIYQEILKEISTGATKPQIVNALIASKKYNRSSAKVVARHYFTYIENRKPTGKTPLTGKQKRPGKRPGNPAFAYLTELGHAGPNGRYILYKEVYEAVKARGQNVTKPEAVAILEGFKFSKSSIQSRVKYYLELVDKYYLDDDEL